MNSKLIYTGLISLVVALGGFLMGFDAGVVSGANPFYKEYFFLSDWALGWSVGCLTFGAMLGNAIAGPLADRFGRKPVLHLAALLYSVSAICSALATDFSFFIVARMLGGVAVGLALLIAPIYIAEISPPKLRGRFVSFNQLNIVIGFSAVFFSNYYILKMAESDAFEFIDNPNCWRWMLGTETLPAILYFFLLFLVPRSPRWLAQHGRYDESLDVLGRVLGPEEAAKSLGEIKENIASDEGKKPSVAELFARRMSYIMFIALGLGFFQQITGINAIFFYAPTIFEKTGIPQENAFLQTIIIGLVNLGFTVLAIVLIDRSGRKTLLLLGTSGMAICLLTMAWAFHSATFQLTAAHTEALNEGFSEETVRSLTPLAEKSFDNEIAFVAELRQLIEPTVLGNSDFYSSLPASLKATVDTIDDSSFVNAATFQAAMIDAVTKPVFVQEFPLAGKNALRSLKKRSFASRDEFFAAIDDSIDRSALDGHVATLVNMGLNIRATVVFAAIIGYIAAFAISLGPVMWAMFSEIFPNRLRGLAISAAGFFNSLVSYAVQQVFPWELSTFGPALTFLIFGIFAILAFLFSFTFIPETKGRTLEQLEEQLIVAD
jgi:SP family arabinose:H+ symporter-like MFS transporter